MPETSERTIVWDWTVRLFHWLIVVLVPLMWWTAEQGMMDWHRRMGVTLLGLVVFRLFWGLFGSWTARFGPMVRRIGSLRNYVAELRKGRHRPAFGHNPMGMLSVFAMILALCIQIATGLFSVDIDGLESGPLAVLVSFDTGREFADIHDLNFNFLCALIALHIAAILVYRFILKDRLIAPMISGRRLRSDFSSGDLPQIRVGLVTLVLGLAATAGTVYAVLNAA